MSDTAKKTCACQDEDSYACFAFRYGREFYFAAGMDEEIEDEGGPCECFCHADVWSDDDYNGGW